MKKVSILVLALLVSFGFGCGKPVDDAATVQVQYDELVRPIVRIKGRAELPDGRVAQWTGSGVVVYSAANEVGSACDTYILTCNHVVEVPIFDTDTEATPSPWGAEAKIKGFKYEVDYVEIFNSDGTSRKVSGIVVLQSNNNVFEMNKDGDIVVRTGEVKDEETGQEAGEDLALVRLNTVEKLQSVKMMARSDIDKLRVFFKARVVGCSLGGRPYQTFGEITILQSKYMSVNAQFVPGNSGGAAFLDSTHEFIGITNAGPNPVWHMGLIRPLTNIYDWLDKDGYSFIYDKNSKLDSKLQALRLDRDRPFAEQQAKIRRLTTELNATKAQLKTLFRAITSLSEMVNKTEVKTNSIQEALNDILNCIANV